MRNEHPVRLYQHHPHNHTTPIRVRLMQPNEFTDLTSYNEPTTVIRVMPKHRKEHLGNDTVEIHVTRWYGEEEQLGSVYGDCIYARHLNAIVQAIEYARTWPANEVIVEVYPLIVDMK